MHWDVWGHRNQLSGTEWQAELVDNETSNQIRVRKSYMTANFHDVTISPNIAYINNIFEQERKATDWGKNIIMGLHKSLVEGTVIYKSILDKTEDPDGRASEIVCDNASCFPSPYATSLKKNEGCWYFIYATMQTRQHVKEAYPDLDMDKVDAATSQRIQEVSLTVGEEEFTQLAHTKLVDVLECWMDDDTLENIPYKDVEASKEHEAVEEGVTPPVYDDQNHKEHIKSHMGYLNSLSDGITEESGEDEQRLAQAKAALMMSHIEQHMKTENYLGMPKGKKKKYPFGRKMVVCGGVLAEDEENKFGVDWRKLFHRSVAEEIPESFWGRGMVEILWNTQKTLDTMVSRISDTAITTSMPMPWLSIDDKSHVEKHNTTNDPTKIHYYMKQPPVFPSGSAPKENYSLYEFFKSDAQKQQGVNDVTYGGQLKGEPSGKTINMLLRQNTVLVTGEANTNLADTIEEIVETRLQIWKQFYTEPRWYFINGEMQAITLSEELKYQKKKNPQTGEMEKKPIPMFQITVKPNSNFPNQWEIDFGFMLQLAQTPMPDGTPLVDREALVDMLAAKYPQFGRNGIYYQMAQATGIGLKVIQQQQAKEAEEQKTLHMAAQQFKSKALGKMMSGGHMVEPQEEPQNGAQQ